MEQKEGTLKKLADESHGHKVCHCRSKLINASSQTVDPGSKIAFSPDIFAHEILCPQAPCDACQAVMTIAFVKLCVEVGIRVRERSSRFETTID